MTPNNRFPQWLAKLLGRYHQNTARGTAERIAEMLQGRPPLTTPYVPHVFVSREESAEAPFLIEAPSRQLPPLAKPEASTAIAEPNAIGL